MSGTPLGKKVDYSSQYTKDVLHPIPRSEARKIQGIDCKDLPFTGSDLWTAYELSYLNAKGKPQVFIGTICIPSDSENMVESKSLKLYLNSLNQVKFSSSNEFMLRIKEDVSEVVNIGVDVKLHTLDEFTGLGILKPQSHCIDDEDITITTYTSSPSLLTVESDEVVRESLYSHLLKSNCRITSQPDWGTLFINYEGKKINHQNLLAYIVALREHDEFHEPCVEKIFHEITQQCQPEKLTVYARYTRRGGLDINPFRSNYQSPPEFNTRLVRQ